MLRKLYIAFGLFVIGAYLYAGLTGYEPIRPERSQAPQGVRGAHGGWSVWYSGYQGGK